jgi:hypothetical protein
MRKITMGLGALVLAVTALAQDFTQSLTAEEQAAAGLGKLTPAELVKLLSLVERYKTGEVTVVRAQAEQKVAAAEVRVKQAEAKTTAAEAKKEPGWIGALLTLQKAEAKPDAAVVTTRLAGRLVSFSGRRDFTLENGQVWRMIEPDIYAGPALENPEVTIRPGLLGVIWLRIREGGVRVKVKPIKLE